MSNQEIDDLPSVDGVSQDDGEFHGGDENEAGEHEGDDHASEGESHSAPSEPEFAYTPPKNVFKEFFAGLFSSEDNYRLIAYLFFGSIVGVVITLLLTIQTFLAPRSEVSAHLASAEKKEVKVEKKKEEAHGGHGEKAKGPPESDALSLGVFNFDLNPSAEEKKYKLQRGAEVEVVLMCDTPETCTAMKEAIPILRDKISGLFFKLDRNDLMSKDGKARLRKRIVDAVNDWLSQGKILDAFFPHLVLV